MELSQVVGENARRTRIAAGATIEDVSRTSKMYGLNWLPGRVRNIESGRGAVSFGLGTLVGLAAVLGDLRGEPVALSDLVISEAEHIELSKGFTMSAENLRIALSGEPVVYRAGDLPDGAAQAAAAMTKAFQDWSEVPQQWLEVPVTVQEQVERGSGEAERQAAASLGVSAVVLKAASAYLWGRSLSQERDLRAGPDATPKQRGHVTRTLKAELRAELKAAGNGG